MAGKQQLEFEAVVSAAQLNKLLDDFRNGVEGAGRALNDALGGTVKKTLLLETREDATGIRTLVAAEKERLSVTDRIANAQKRVNDIQKDSVTSLRQQVNTAKQARDEVTRYSTASGGLFNIVKQVNPEWAKQNERVAELSRKLDIASASGFWGRLKADLNLGGLFNFSNNLVEITQGLQAASILIGSFTAQINNLINATAKLQSFELSFVAAGAGGAGGAQALQEASRIALGLGANIGTVRESFQKLTPVILNSGGTLGSVSQITQALSSRFAAFGLSADASRRAMNGIIQAFSKGKLQAEELTQQISEADPAFKTDFAGALGVTVAQLERMVQAGQITNDVLLRTLPLLSKSALLYGKLGSSASSAVAALDRSGLALGEVGVTTEQVRTQLDTLSQLNLERFATAFQPVTNAFLAAQAVVIDFIANITKLEGAKGLGQALGALTQAVVNLLQALSSIAQVIATALSPILSFAGAILNSVPGVALLTSLIGFKLIAAFAKIPAAIASGRAAFITLGANVTATIQKYVGLGAAATTAAGQVAAAQATIGAAGAAGGAAGGAKQLSLLGNAGDLAGTVGEVQQLTLELGNAQKTGAKLFPTFSKAFGAISSGSVSAGGAIKGLEKAVKDVGPKIASSFTSAASGIQAAAAVAGTSIKTLLATPLTGLVGILAPVAAAFVVLGVSIENVKSIMSGAKEVTDLLNKSLGDLNAELAKQKQEVGEVGTKWDASVQNVGGFAAGVDRIFSALGVLAPGLKTVSNESAKYNQATIAAADASTKLKEGMDGLVANYKKLKTSEDGSVESQQKIKEAFDGVSNAYQSRISALDAQILKEKQLASSSGQVDESKQGLIRTLEAEKVALEAEARAGGFSIQVQKDRIAVIKEAAAQIKAINEKQISELEKEKEGIKNKYAEEKRLIDEKKQKLKESYDQEKERLADLQRSTKEYYTSQKDAIREVRNAEAARAAEQIRTLQALTPAERQLQQIRITELQETASKGGKEGLEARAQLERIAANEKIAQIQEEERKKEEAAKVRLAELERQEKETLKKIDEEERAKERAHKEQMRELEKGERENKEGERKAVEEIDGRIAILQEQIKKATEQAAEAAGDFTGNMETAEAAAVRVKKLMEEIKVIASQIRIPNVANSRFAGGPVTAGGAYTVNEFGPEMFLSSSGRLSRINAKPWATWRAPSSGTVIPAHIAAGLDVPRGGIRPSRGDSSVVDRAIGGSQSGRMMGQVIAAINASMRSSNNRDTGMQELVSVQAAQAMQIGKLGRAVDQLASKDWSVNVRVKNTGTAAYLQALNHRM